ncbi:hypothetical protein D3C85_691790 [compost metagenome]
MTAHLQRFAYTPQGTFGRLTIGNQQWYTVERPWQNNEAQVSCIPEGVYPLRMRQSGVISRSTGGAYSRGWEVTGVPGRTFIMLHPGNTMDDLLGCISPGKQLGFVKGKWAVSSSRPAFDEIMGALSSQDEWTLTIDQYRVTT